MRGEIRGRRRRSDGRAHLGEQDALEEDIHETPNELLHVSDNIEDDGK